MTAIKWILGIIGLMLLVWGGFCVWASSIKYVASREGSLQSNWLQELGAFLLGCAFLSFAVFGWGENAIVIIFISPFIFLGIIVLSGGLFGVLAAIGIYIDRQGDRTRGVLLRALAVVGVGVGMVFGSLQFSGLVRGVDSSTTGSVDEEFAAEQACTSALGTTLGSYRSGQATGEKGSFTVEIQREIGGVGGRCPALIVGRCQVTNGSAAVTQPWKQEGYVAC